MLTGHMDNNRQQTCFLNNKSSALEIEAPGIEASETEALETEASETDISHVNATNVSDRRTAMHYGVTQVVDRNVSPR